MNPPEILSENGVAVVVPQPTTVLIDRIDVPLFDEVLELARSNDPPHMIVDLEHIPLINKKFLGILVELRKALIPQSKKCGVCQVAPICHEVFAITKMNLLLDVFETREEAIAAYLDTP